MDLTQERRPDRSRALFWLISLLFLGVGVRLFQLQVFQGQRYGVLAERNRIKVVYLPALRGEIVDRDGEVLADSRPGYSVFAAPDEIEEPTVTGLAPILGMRPREIEELLKVDRVNPFDPVKVARDVGIGVVSRLEERRQNLPGVMVKALPIRRYRYGEKLAHLIGYVGDLTQEELGSLRPKGYKYGDVIGRMGLEREYEEHLKGEDGIEYVEVNALGRELGTYAEKNPLLPSPGEDLILTIDIDLQLRADSLLAERGNGCIVAIDPRNGEVLALASRPSFDPNILAAGIDPQSWLELREDTTSPLWNRGTRATYPPGSVFKLLTAASASEREVIESESHFRPCRGGMFIGKRRFGCWKAHGRTNLHQAIVQSCDTYFYQLGMKIGLEGLSQDARSCGFGSPTGVDLPRESSGFVPTRKWYQENLTERGYGAGVVANLAIGQGEILVTPLQLCCFVGGIAMRGIQCRPHLVRGIIDQDGEIVREPAIERRNLPLSPETLDIARGAMWGVVNEEKGTGRLAQLSEVAIAGKTGTAQSPEGEDHAWFCGFAPYDEPRITVTVLIENAGHGGALAAPVVKELIRFYLEDGGDHGG